MHHPTKWHSIIRHLWWRMIECLLYEVHILVHVLHVLLHNHFIYVLYTRSHVPPAYYNAYLMKFIISDPLMQPHSHWGNMSWTDCGHMCTRVRRRGVCDNWALWKLYYFSFNQSWKMLKCINIYIYPVSYTCFRDSLTFPLLNSFYR